MICRYTDVKRKSNKSLFIRPHEGLFGLREWKDEGIQYEVTFHSETNRTSKLTKLGADSKWHAYMDEWDL